jgi:hypothetical protein
VQVVCGFVSTVEQWSHFERNWNEVLNMPQFDLEYLHTKELRSGKGRFAKFRGNLTLQKELFDRLQRTIVCRIQQTFAVAVLLDDYDRVTVSLRSKRLGGTSPDGIRFAIGKLTSWWHARQSPDQVLAERRLHTMVRLQRTRRLRT